MVPAHVARRHLVLAAAACAGLAVVALVDPNRRALGPPCPLRTVTGLDCPMCGATRATHALLRGDLATALDDNALLVLALPVAVFAAVAWLRSGRLPAPLRGPTGPWVLVAVAVVFGVVRNLPSFGALAS